MKKIFAGCFALVFSLGATVHAAMPITTSFSFNGAQVNLGWAATPGAVYVLNTSSNLSQPWQGTTFSATNNSIAVSYPVVSRARFFQVVKLDTQGPQIYQTSPLNNSIGVGQQAALQAWISDETGINTNSIVFAVGTNAPVTLSDPRLTWATNGVLTYTPGTNEVLGALGQTVAVSLSVADTLGNQTTNFTWSFQLALPTVISTNIVFLGSGPNPPASLILLSTNGNTYTYSFTGASSGLTNGMQLVNANPTNGYTVTVVSFTQNSTNDTVAVVTRPTLLSELLQQGSLASGSFSQVTNNGPSQQLLTQLGLQLNYSYPLSEVLYSDPNLTIGTTPGSAVSLAEELNVAANFSGFSLTSFQATLQGTANFQLDFEALAQAAESYSGEITLIQPVSRTYFGTIGPVPVWLTVEFEVDAGFDASLEAQGTITAGMSASKQVTYGRHWDQNTGWTTISQNPAAGFSFQQPAWQIRGSADLTVYLLPKVTLLVNSLAGVTGDLKPYVDLNYTFQLNPEECDLGLYAGLDGDLGLDLAAWDSNWGAQPSVTFTLIPETLLWHTNCTDMPPEITSEPENQSFCVGSTAVFMVVAEGADPLSYKWLRNGLPLTDDGRITGSTTATLSIADAQTYDAGGYSVHVSNDAGTANSSEASLADTNCGCSSGPVTPGANMALIPAGVFTMGDSLDGLFNAPLTTVNVSAFYMDEYDVTETLWDQVYDWAIANGYDFDDDGGAEAEGAIYPVQSVNWYDCVKWCNARSEMEGRVPAYYTDDTQTNVYRTGDIDLDNGSVKWCAGYRLPTEAEWEKAARGGLCGQRFPWGDTISWSQANYYGDPLSLDPTNGISYDLATAIDYDPAYYTTNEILYTSPVGSFGSNGYGLSDMAGNVEQWCWDWYGTPYEGGTDPRGPDTGQDRVSRGGCWYLDALFCRTAFRYVYYGQAYAVPYTGFRCVLPPGQ